jgi:hypothetical protein
MQDIFININNDINNNNYLKLSDFIKLKSKSIKIRIDVVDEIIKLDILPLIDYNELKKMKNNFDYSLFHLVYYPKMSSCVFEMPFVNINELNQFPDIICGFIPHPNTTQNTIIKIKIELIKKSFWFNNKSYEWIVQIDKNKIDKNKKFIPFLYGEYMFPRISFANYKVKLSCDSQFKPTILYANFQTDERVYLARSKINIPVKKYTPLFPEFNTNYNHKNVINLS